MVVCVGRTVPMVGMRGHVSAGEPSPR